MNDVNLDLDILGKDQWWSRGKPDAMNAKLLKLQVRIRGIIEGLLEFTNEKDMARPLRLFIDRLTSNGCFIPQSYLLGYEKARLNFDQFGSLCNQSDEKKRMIICFFFITRILVSKFLMKPTELNLPVRQNTKVPNNLRVIASFLQILVLSRFVRTAREPHEAAVDEAQILGRKKGLKLSTVFII